MSDIATQGLLPHSQTLRTRRVETQVEAIQRNRAGASLTTIGSGGSVADATTSVKGKLKLAGHFAGTADVPIIATTATPQITRLSIGATAPTSPFGVYIRATSTLKGTYVADYGETFDFQGMNSVIRNASATINPTNMAITNRQSNFYSRATVRGAGQVSAGGWLGNFVQMVDDAGVQQKTISTISAGGLVTLASGTHSFVAGERVIVSGTSSATNNDEYIVGTVPNNTTFNLLTSAGSSLAGGGSTGGVVTNAPFYFGLSVGVNPIVDRSVLSSPVGQSGGVNGDDVGGVSVHNSGSGRGTDGFYLADSAGVSGSAWVSAFTCDADCDYGFRLGTVTIGADSTLTAYNEPAGAAFDCSNATLASGAHAMRLMNDGWIASKDTAASSSYIRMLGVNSSDQICVGDLGTNNQLSFFRNNTHVFFLNSSFHVQFTSSRRIGFNIDPLVSLHLADTSATGGMQFVEQTAPGAPAADNIRLYAKDDAGTTKLFTHDTVRGEVEVGTGTGTTYPVLSGTTTDTLAVRSAGTNTFQTIASNTTAGVARLSFLDQATEKWRVQQGGGSGIETDFQFNIIDATDANHLIRFMSGVPQSTGSTKHRYEYNVTATLPASGRRILNTNFLSTVTGTVSQPSPYDLIDVLQATAHLNTSGGANGISMVALIGEAKVSAAQHADNEVAYLRGASFDQTLTGAIHPTMWGQDLFVHGTRAASGTTGEQNRKIFNIVCGINTYHSSSPSHAPAVGMSITTKYGDVLGAPAGNTDRTHTVDTGLSIHGWAGDANGISHANSKTGFKYGIKIGGTGAWYSGDPWTDTTQHSRIGTGIQVMHYETAGIKVTNRSTIGATSPPAISIGWDNAGAASTVAMDGLDFGGDTNLYRSAADRLKTDDSMTVAGTQLLLAGNLALNNASGGYIDLIEQGSAPATPVTTYARLYVLASGATSTLNLMDDAGVVTTFGAGGGSGDAVLAGQAGGQTLHGGTAAADELTLKPSSHGSPATGDVVVDLAGTGQNLRIKPKSTIDTTLGTLVQVGDAFTMGAGGQFSAYSVFSAVAVSGTAAATGWQCFYFGPTITLGTAATDDLRQGYVFSDQATVNLSATTTAYGTTSNGWRSYRASPIFADRTGGTSTGTLTLVTALRAEPTIGTGWTVTDLRGVHIAVPPGTAGTITTHTGVDIEDLDAYAGTNTNPSLSLRSIGTAVQMRHAGPGVFGANAAPSNASVGLEVQSTTKAIRFPTMTTAQKNALTPLEGMAIYDTDLDKLQVYNAATTAWESCN